MSSDAGADVLSAPTHAEEPTDPAAQEPIAAPAKLEPTGKAATGASGDPTVAHSLGGKDVPQPSKAEAAPGSNPEPQALEAETLKGEDPVVQADLEQEKTPVSLGNTDLTGQDKQENTDPVGPGKQENDTLEETKHVDSEQPEGTESKVERSGLNEAAHEKIENTEALEKEKPTVSSPPTGPPEPSQPTLENVSVQEKADEALLKEVDSLSKVETKKAPVEQAGDPVLTPKTAAETADQKPADSGAKTEPAPGKDENHQCVSKDPESPKDPEGLKDPENPENSIKREKETASVAAEEDPDKAEKEKPEQAELAPSSTAAAESTATSHPDTEAGQAFKDAISMATESMAAIGTSSPALSLDMPGEKEKESKNGSATKGTKLKDKPAPVDTTKDSTDLSPLSPSSQMSRRATPLRRLLSTLRRPSADTRRPNMAELGTISQRPRTSHDEKHPGGTRSFDVKSASDLSTSGDTSSPVKEGARRMFFVGRVDQRSRRNNNNPPAPKPGPEQKQAPPPTLPGFDRLGGGEALDGGKLGEDLFRDIK